jgi:hypothetical protein
MTGNSAQQYNLATLPTARFIGEDPPNPDQQEPTNDDLTTTQATESPPPPARIDAKPIPHNHLLRLLMQKSSVEALVSPPD